MPPTQGVAPSGSSCGSASGSGMPWDMWNVCNAHAAASPVTATAATVAATTSQVSPDIRGFIESSSFARSPLGLGRGHEKRNDSEGWIPIYHDGEGFVVRLITSVEDLPEEGDGPRPRLFCGLEVGSVTAGLLPQEAVARALVGVD